MLKRMNFLNCIGIEVGESRDFFIRLIPTATTLFSISKLNMSRNNVRSSDEGNSSFLIYRMLLILSSYSSYLLLFYFLNNLLNNK